MAQNSGNYSIAGILNIKNGFGEVLFGNDVGNILFGDTSEGAGGLLFAEGAPVPSGLELARS
jgi:hypothetical protein